MRKGSKPWSSYHVCSKQVSTFNTNCYVDDILFIIIKALSQQYWVSYMKSSSQFRFIMGQILGYVALLQVYPFFLTCLLPSMFSPAYHFSLIGHLPAWKNFSSPVSLLAYVGYDQTISDKFFLIYQLQMLALRAYMFTIVIELSEIKYQIKDEVKVV